MRLHLQGMWVAFSVAAVLTAYFVVQMSGAIDRRDAEMARIRDRAARTERLASLATLAAGAAHELGTPLATIAVVARELERSLRAIPGAPASPLLEDATLIRSELDRCRAILDRMAADVGQGPGEAPAAFGVPELVAEAFATVPVEERVRVEAATTGVDRIYAPRGAVLRVVQNLLENALDAARSVRLRVDADEGGLLVVVEDDGPGMTREVLARVGEPFFSTKGPGRASASASSSPARCASRWAVVSRSSRPRASARRPGPGSRAAGRPGRGSRMASEARPLRLLLVEDDDVLRRRLARAFRERGFVVGEAAGVAEAERAAREAPPSHALVDLRLGDGSGLDIVRALASLSPAPSVVVLTGYGSIATALEAVRLGARHYLTKPADVDEILAAFARERPADPLPPTAVPTLARVEWEHINRVLADCGGNVSQAARLLGIHRRSLQRKLAKFPSAR